MSAALQFWIKIALTFGATLGIVFMIICTAFVVISFIRGDIRINIVRSEEEKEKY